MPRHKTTRIGYDTPKEPAKIMQPYEEEKPSNKVRLILNFDVIGSDNLAGFAMQGRFKSLKKAMKRGQRIAEASKGLLVFKGAIT